jgi:aminoglycoside phosphotransferase (APT) family kinase protein
MGLDPDNAFRRLAQKIDPASRLLRAWQVTGGVSAQVTGLEVERADGSRAKLIVRRHGEADLRGNPDIARDEFRLLERLRAAGLRVPEPVHLDRSGEIFETPCVVIEFIEGEPVHEPEDGTAFAGRLAEILAGIHQVDLAAHDFSFLPRKVDSVAAKLAERPKRVDETLGAGEMRAALEVAWPLTPRNATALLHGDFWPGNLLWRGGELAAIIDWEDAALGDPLADLGNVRFEVSWSLGVEAMEALTRRYLDLMPSIDPAQLPYWDLCATLTPAAKMHTWGLDAATEQALRAGLRWFIEQALERVS